jgi:Icc-related predicted phosphoesterase
MRIRRGLLGLLVAVVAAVGALAALPLFPRVRHDLGPVSVTAESKFGTGRTIFVAPPLGTVSADTHSSPLEVRVALSSVDVGALEDRFQQGGVPDDVIAAVEDDLRGLTIRLVIQILVGGAVVGLLVAAVLPQRRIGFFLWALGGAVFAAGVLLASTFAAFDETAFEEPTFTGALTRAPEVLDALERGPESFEAIGSRYEVLAVRVSELLSLTTDPTGSGRDFDAAILHVSDVHSNPLGLEVVKRLAGAFSVDAVVDTGDLTSFGEPLETSVVRTLRDLDTPYYFVPGNHDSPANRVALDASSSLTLLDREVASIGGVDVLGWADPTFTADNETSTEEGNEARLEQAEEVADEVSALSPDVLAVHDARLAEEAVGDVRLVLAGHTHERDSEEREGTLVLTVGSTGATGLGSFLVETDLPYEAEVVYFRDEAPAAVDYVRFFGLGEEFEIDREVIDPD